jgi:hypothetical protein
MSILIASTSSIIGFWAALAAIAFASCVAIRNSLRRDRNGLIADSAGSSVVVVIAAPLMAAIIIATTSGGVLTVSARGEGPSSNLIPELAQRVLDSDFMTEAITGAIMLWFYALMSSLVVLVMRLRQQRRLNHSAQ